MLKVLTVPASPTVRSKAAINWRDFWRAIDTGAEGVEAAAKIEATVYIAERFAFADDGAYFLLEL